MTRVRVVGIGCHPGQLTLEAREAIAGCDYVIAADKGGDDPLLALRRATCASLGVELVAVADPPRDRSSGLDEAGYDGVDEERVSLIRQRRVLSTRSHDLFAGAKSEGDLALYLDGMRPLIDSYQNATKMAFSVRVRNKVKRETWKIVRKLGRA